MSIVERIKHFVFASKDTTFGLPEKITSRQQAIAIRLSKKAKDLNLEHEVFPAQSGLTFCAYFKEKTMEVTISDVLDVSFELGHGWTYDIIDVQKDITIEYVEKELEQFLC